MLDDLKKEYQELMQQYNQHCAQIGHFTGQVKDLEKQIGDFMMKRSNTLIDVDKIQKKLQKAAQEEAAKKTAVPAPGVDAVPSVAQVAGLEGAAPAENTQASS